MSYDRKEFIFCLIKLFQLFGIYFYGFGVLFSLNHLSYLFSNKHKQLFFFFAISIFILVILNNNNTNYFFS